MSRDAAFERALPNSAEAERAILGAILLANHLIDQAVEWLVPEAFYVPSHRRIFVAMIYLAERGSEINPILIGEELKKENALEAVGGISFITNLTHGLPHSSNIAHYAKVVRGKYMLRQLIKGANQITLEALEEEDDPEIILDHAEQIIFKLAEKNTREGFVGAKQVADEVLDQLQEAESAGKSAITGLSTGFVDLDALTSGLQPSDLIILAARPSMGKTGFAMMVAENVAIRGAGVSAIFSLEMSKKALVTRMLCAEAQVDSMRFRRGWIAKNEWARLAAALGSISESRIFIDDTPSISVLEMRAKARRLAQEQKKLDLIIVDYLQLAKGHGKTESRQQEVSQISRELKSLAKELNVPLVALSQLSRAPETRTSHRPQLGDLRESGALEQDADVVAFIFREEQYLTAEQREALPDDKKNVAELIIAKQRNGPTGSVELRFTPSTVRFDNMYRE